MQKIFIDGEAGTTGLQIRQRLEGRRDLDVVSIDPARRKDADARAEFPEIDDCSRAIFGLTQATHRNTSQAHSMSPG